jgi:3-phenylpropionate/cinnamic acid dioxygenase small subunit
MEHSDDGGALAIHHVLARLAYASDEGSLDEYQALFTEDAELIVDDPRIAVPGSEAVRGSAQIRATAEKRREAKTSGPGSNTRHVVSTIAVEVDGHDATSTASWLLFRDSNGIPSLVGVGQYRDRLRLDDHGWRIASRTITRDQG